MKLSVNEWILLVYLLNFCLALIYTVYMRIKTGLNYVFLRGIVMVLCPVTALVCYLLSYLQELLVQEKEVDYENLSMDKTKKEFITGVDAEMELKTLPIEEVLTVSTKRDRREAIINLLKTAPQGHISLIHKAVDNDDTETAHYAASALTSISQNFMDELKKMQAAYVKDPQNTETIQGYINLVARILKSRISSGATENTYMNMYVRLVEKLEEEDWKAVTVEHCYGMVRIHMRRKEAEQAEIWAARSIERWPEEEQAYFNMLYTAYNLGKKEEFNKYLVKIQESDVILSRDGINKLRYWTGK